MKKNNLSIHKQENKVCENCKFYLHKPSILGGIAECVKSIKSLNTFWTNEACETHEYTNEDKLKDQRNCYKDLLK